MSLLTIVQGASRRCNYGQPAYAFGTSDANIQLFIDCVQDTGDEMVERADWQALKISTPVTFTGNGVQTLFPLPAGFASGINRLSPSTTFVSSAYPTLNMVGPVGEDDLIRMKALPLALYPSVWRVVDSHIEFFPAPASGEIISYVYGQGQWITNSAGIVYSVPAFTADSDLVLLSERVLRLGTIAKWKQAKGFDYGEAFSTYEASLDRVSSQETTGRVINMAQTDVLWDETWPGQITDNTDQSY